MTRVENYTILIILKTNFTTRKLFLFQSEKQAMRL